MDSFGHTIVRRGGQDATVNIWLVEVGEGAGSAEAGVAASCLAGAGAGSRLGGALLARSHGSPSWSCCIRLW